jgi:WD40 repeat protein
MRTLLLILLSLNLSAQENRWWHVGGNMRLDFATNPPTVTAGGCVNTTEGCASISDAAGNFLFATDGVTAYSSNCSIMANGTLLSGGASSTQSAIIVKNPVLPNIYYIFTASQDASAPGIAYSEVNMTLNAGLGAVTGNKNILLTPGLIMSEKLTTALHCNGEDVWVISKRWQSNNYMAWLVTGLGVNTVPIVSSAGFTPNLPSGVSYGQLKASPSGTKLAAAYYGFAGGYGNTGEICDFNRATGQVTNPISLGTITGLYGIEWSPSGEILYAATNQGLLYQWQVCVSNIPATRTLIANTGPFFGSLQTSPYGQIILAKGTATRHACIRNPEGIGAACLFTDNYYGLIVGSRMGLPNFRPDFIFQDPQAFQFNDVNCLAIQFISPPETCTSEQVISYLWDFEDGTTSTLANPIHAFPNSSPRNVTLTINYQCRSITLSANVNPIGGLFGGLIFMN